MSRAYSKQAPATRQQQQGISLLMVLLLLIVMSILGIAVLRSSSMQERMSANLRDRNDAFQAAESGLRDAQATVILGTLNAMWDGSKDFATLRGAQTCAANGLCDRSDPNVPANWETAPTKPTGWTSMASGARYGYTVEFLGNAKGESAEVQGVCNTSSAPRYLCQRPTFRITSYGRGKGLAQVVLQANILSQPI
jgi:type IV pilus assembly protein PilX